MWKSIISSLFNKIVGLYDNRPYSSNNDRIYGTTGVTEVEIDERSVWARPVSIDVLESDHMVSEAISR